LDFHQLEERQMLASVTVSNATDLTNADTSSISALIANDGGDGISLREAIVASNNTAGEDSIDFDGSVFSGGAASLIRLVQGELEITESLSIDGSTATDVTITGDANGDDVTLAGTFITNVAASFDESAANLVNLLSDNSRVLNFTPRSSSPENLTLSDLTVTGGSTGSIYGEYGDAGGGIASRFGNVSLVNSIVSGNGTFGVPFGGAGGGVYVRSGDLSLTNSEVTGNRSRNASGGGISVLNGDVSLLNSDVSGNTADDSGGGVFVTGNVSLVNSIVSENSSGGMPFVDGGGIWAGGTVSLLDSTISGNSATGRGGGVFVRSSIISLINSTLSGNYAAESGGGINALSVSLLNSTVTDNETAYVGGGISSRGVTITNSIVAGNTDNGTAPDVTGRDLVVEHSLIGDTTGSEITNSTGVGNILDQPALLGPLADNGGPTLTHALLPGSPAIDAGSDTLAVDADGVPLSTDQRGDGFDRSLFGRVDIGAFESDFDAPPIAPTVLSVSVDEGGVLARPDLWNTLNVVFDSGVAVTAGDLSLFNDSVGVKVDLSGIGFSFDSLTNTATWDFGDLAAPLDAAFYKYQLDADSITFEGLSLDGDGDGTGSDDFVGRHYVAIPGDANLDGVVDVLNDALALVGNLNSTTNLAWADGNFNGDGIVSVLGDAITLVTSLNRDVRPTTAVASFSTASFSTSALVQSRSRFSLNPNAASLRSDSIGDFDDDQGETIHETDSLASSTQSSSLVLAGAHELRDDVFASDF